MTSQLDIKGKGAIVTGAGSGINLAFVQELYKAGCSSVIVDIGLHQTAIDWLSILTKDNGPKVYFHEADASDWKELENAFQVYDREIGGVPYISHHGFWSDDDIDGHYRLFDINLLSPIKMTRLAIRKMLAVNQPGIILHVSSTGAQKASIITPLYQAGKSAISTFVRCLADLHRMGGIRVVGVAPGIIKSPLFTDHPEVMRYIDSSKDCMLEPSAVARAMLAVATDLNYPAGTILEVADLDDSWRVVNMLNDPGPQGRASWSSNKHLALEDVKRVVDSERGMANCLLILNQ